MRLSKVATFTLVALGIGGPVVWLAAGSVDDGDAVVLTRPPPMRTTVAPADFGAAMALAPPPSKAGPSPAPSDQPAPAPTSQNYAELGVLPAL